MLDYFVKINVQGRKDAIHGHFIACNEVDLKEKILRDLNKCFTKETKEIDFEIIRNGYVEHITYNPRGVLNESFSIITQLEQNRVSHSIFYDNGRSQSFICGDIPTYELARFIVNSFKNDRFDFS